MGVCVCVCVCEFVGVLVIDRVSEWMLELPSVCM
jgi:hypothetical protein